VNEQAQVSVLLAGPGVLATLTFAPLVVALLYSSEFGAAVGTLRWICLGMGLRVITWPLGFVVVAKGLQRLFIAIDLACAVVQLALAWILVQTFGLEGAGMAFFGLYVFHAFLINPIARRLSGFRWSPTNRRMGAFFAPLIALVFAGFVLLPPVWATGFGTLAVVGSSIYSARALAKLVPPERLPRIVRSLFVRLRLVRGTG
jgi:PST family polysaccharide transporter